MKMVLSLISFVIIFSITVSGQTASQMKAAAEAERSAIDAYRAKRYLEFRSQMQTANANRPNHPRLIYNLAAANALTGETKSALDLLEQLADMGQAYDFERDEDFAPLRADERFKKVILKGITNRRPAIGSIIAGTHPDRTLIAESVSIDPKTGAFFLGSVHQRKIVRIDRAGKASDFSSPEDGLWSVLGTKIDLSRGHLWVATSAVPQMKGFRPEDRGRSGIFKYDLRTAKVLRKYILPDGEEHTIGDLLIDDNGNVFATDSVSPTIFRIDVREQKLEPFLSLPDFASLQGLTFGRDKNELFVADYSKGIFRIDISTKTVKQLIPGRNVTLLGIDGLYYYGGRLIAIQNGVNPNRVVSLHITGDRVDSFQTLEANHPDHMEPTLGVIEGDDLYYVANSQWPLVNEKAELDLAKLRTPVILKLGLKPRHNK